MARKTNFHPREKKARTGDLRSNPATLPRKGRRKMKVNINELRKDSLQLVALARMYQETFLDRVELLETDDPNELFDRRMALEAYYMLYDLSDSIAKDILDLADELEAYDQKLKMLNDQLAQLRNAYGE